MKKIEKDGKMFWPCCGKEWCDIYDGFGFSQELPLLFRLLPHLFVGAILMAIGAIVLSVL